MHFNDFSSTKALKATQLNLSTVMVLYNFSKK